MAVLDPIILNEVTSPTVGRENTISYGALAKTQEIFKKAKEDAKEYSEQPISKTQTVTINSFSPDQTIKKQAVNHSFVTEKWEGIITEVKETSFLAHLYKKGIETREIIEGEFEIEDVPLDDRKLISEGVFFYWVHGREVTKGGQVSNKASIIIRRMPSWKKFDINKSSKKADEFYSFFTNK